MEEPDMEISPWLVMLLGMGTVFVGLTVLIGIVNLMGAIVRGKTDKAKSVAPAAATPVPAAPAVNAAPAVSAAPAVDRGQLDAVVGATIATYLGTEPEGIRINSMQQVGAGGNERKQLSAVIACAIACSMKKDISAIRILGIKQV